MEVVYEQTGRHKKSGDDRMWICWFSIGICIMQSGLFSELVLIDANHDKAEGEAMDIAHGLPFAGQMKIYAGDYDDIVDAAVIIVTPVQPRNQERQDLI